MELCITEAKQWLIGMGLEISDEKSKLRDAREGFKFLGFQIILVKKENAYKVKMTPSKANRLRFLDKVRTVIRSAKAWSSYDLVRVLRPIYLGWANYYSTTECKDIFTKLNNSILGMLRAWAFRRDTRHGRFFIKQKYFPSGCKYSFHGRSYHDNWILVGQTKKRGKLVLPHLFWVLENT
jgi:RNA-directed DNA polymerase